MISSHASRGAGMQKNALVERNTGNLWNEKVLPLKKQKK
jgi:hypothetical protein